MAARLLAPSLRRVCARGDTFLAIPRLLVGPPPCPATPFVPRDGIDGSWAKPSFVASSVRPSGAAGGSLGPGASALVHGLRYQHGDAASLSHGDSGEGSNGSWWGKMKQLLGGKEATSDRQRRDVSLALEAFADELGKAKQFGEMATFGRGLPRGGEGAVTASLQRQVDIARALAPLLAQQQLLLLPDGAVPPLPSKVKAQAASQVGCSAADVEAFLGKFSWFCAANQKIEERRAQGKPLPKSFAEVEELMGGAWKRAGGGGSSSPPSRNSFCPCGSGKRFKRCCGASAK